VDWFTQQNEKQRIPIGVVGYGEGGLIARYSAAIDPRIQHVFAETAPAVGPIDLSRRVGTAARVRRRSDGKRFSEAETAIRAGDSQARDDPLPRLKWQFDQLGVHAEAGAQSPKRRAEFRAKGAIPSGSTSGTR
jgi:hypothetical protein